MIPRSNRSDAPPGSRGRRDGPASSKLHHHVKLPGSSGTQRLLAEALACMLAGCMHGGSTDIHTASALPGERRQPDGVALDPVSSPPPPSDIAASDQSVITLRAPLGIGSALDVIAAFFRRVVAEDNEGVSELLTRDALALQTGSGGPAQSPNAALWWEQRFRRLEYGQLAGEPIYRESEIEIYRADDVSEAPRTPTIQPGTLDDGDLLVRVPIITTRVAAERLLGDEIVVWLRRDGAKYKIFRLLEDFQLQ